MDDILRSLKLEHPCRDQQIDTLCSLLAQNDFSPPPVLVLHGTEATGKSTVTKAFLDAFDLPHVYISCKECVTVRHLFDRTHARCDALFGDRQKQYRPDSLNALAGQLQKLLLNSRNTILVLDGVDKQREMTPNILSGLARMGQMIPSLTVVMLVNSFGTRLLNTIEPPAVYFPAYTKDECVTILSLHPKSIFELDDEDEYSKEMEEEDRWLWAQCCSAIWDTMGKSAGRSISSLRDVVEELWPLLVQPITDNEYGIRDFPKLFNRLKNEKLRNKEESYLFSSISKNSDDSLSKPLMPMIRTHDLPYYSKYLLCAAFLASFNTAKHDSRYFSKLAEGPGKRKRATKKRNTSRQLNRKHLGARPFPMERMLAIFQSILPAPVHSSVDLGSQIATLSSLRLIRKVSNISSATDASSKWRVSIGYEYARSVGRSVKFDIESHMEE